MIDHSESIKKSSLDPIGVSDLSKKILMSLDNSFPDCICVEGEVGTFYDKKHLYFTLKDNRSQISCVMWSSDRLKLKSIPKIGDTIQVIARISHYPAQGKTQLYIKSISSTGKGKLWEAFQDRCVALRAKGYFDHSLKKNLPTLPNRVAVITAKGSAAFSDIIKTTCLRCGSVELVLFDVPVQGDLAPSLIASNVDFINTLPNDQSVDVIIISRGGGSLEDLWSFNELIVAEAVFNSKIPVVAAIGHESDTTIVELVADVRASTPTAAAVAVVPEKNTLIHETSMFNNFLNRGVLQRIEALKSKCSLLKSNLNHSFVSNFLEKKKKLDLYSKVLENVNPVNKILSLRKENISIKSRIDFITKNKMSLFRKELSNMQNVKKLTFDKLDSLKYDLKVIQDKLIFNSPNERMARGWAFVSDKKGNPVVSVKCLYKSDKIDLAFLDGNAEVEIVSIEKNKV